MDDAKPASEGLPELTEETLKAFQKLTDPKERKAFYEAHPELSRLYSQVNFHTA